MIDIIKLINSLSRPVEGYNIFKIKDIVWGVGSNGEIVFGIDSKNSKTNLIVQTTKYLKLYINNVFDCLIDEKNTKMNLSLFILKDTEERIRKLFVNVCQSMCDTLNEEKLLISFFDLKELFLSQSKPSISELQGLYGELFAMYYFKLNFDLDISVYYQREEKRKFDFSISNIKKIEAKTTIKQVRMHHFLQQQLDTDNFDIKVISIMLQKDDCGFSLLSLIDKCKSMFSNCLNIILYIEKMIKNIDDCELESIKFNLEYTKNNIKIFNGLNIPRVKEKNDNGVFNVEYDVDLENIREISEMSLIDWIKEH